MYELNIFIDDFAIKASELDEHGTYVFRNNLKHLCLAALPETVHSLNGALIDFIMSEDREMSEEVCEIILQLNAKDINFLLLIKNHFEKTTIYNLMQLERNI